jgi:hypothetical protein
VSTFAPTGFDTEVRRARATRIDIASKIMLTKSPYVRSLAMRVFLNLTVEGLPELVRLADPREGNVILRGRNRVEPVTFQSLALVGLNLKRLPHIMFKSLWHACNKLGLNVVLSTILLLPRRIQVKQRPISILRIIAPGVN